MYDMHLIFTSLFLVTHVLYQCRTEGYRIFSMRRLESCANHPAEINLGSVGWNSSGILVSDSDKAFVPGQHCVLFIRSPLSYGVLVSIKYLDLQPAALNYAACHNYLEISPVEGRGSVKLCGYSYDEYEFKSFTVWGRGATIVFHTSNYSSSNKAFFQLTFTAVRKEIHRCFKDETRCYNGYCIWKGLTCDGHNNCGDLSDELDKNISQCGAMTSGESLAVILITIVGSLTLLVIAAYFRGPKISQQIERLSQCRRTDCPQNLPSEAERPPGNVVPTISRLQNSFNPGSGLLPSYNYSVPVHDPPPPYEEVVGLPNGVPVQGAENRPNMT